MRVLAYNKLFYPSWKWKAPVVSNFIMQLKPSLLIEYFKTSKRHAETPPPSLRSKCLQINLLPNLINYCKYNRWSMYIIPFTKLFITMNLIFIIPIYIYMSLIYTHNHIHTPQTPKHMHSNS